MFHIQEFRYIKEYCGICGILLQILHQYYINYLHNANIIAREINFHLFICRILNGEIMSVMNYFSDEHLFKFRLF